VLEISSKRGKIRGNAENLSRNVAASSTSEICFKSRWAKKQLFLLRLKIIIIKLCDVFLWKKKSFFKTQNYLKTLLPHRIYKLNKKSSLFSHRIFGIVFLSNF